MRERKTKQIPHTDELPSFSQEEIKEQGKVYTPYVIIDSILARYSILISPTIRICDPSMGQGNFLRRIFTVLLQQRGTTPNQAFSCLYGFDIDQKAVLKAQQYFIEQGVDKNLVVTQLLCKNPIMELSKWKSAFDIIIGNPPYVRSPKGIPSSYVLRSNLVDVFFEIGLEMLKPGGTLIYIVQDSFLLNEDVILRNYLTQYNILTLETRYDYSKIFRQHNVAVDICLIEIQKQTPQQNDISVWKHQSFKIKSTYIQPNTKWYTYPERVMKLNNKLQQFDEQFSSLVQIKKGRLENKVGTIPTSYGSKTYSKIQTTEFRIPIIGEPNLNYFFPKLPFVYENFTKRLKDPSVQEPFQPFIALPYFTSKFRFCLIEEDVLTTPLVYVFTSFDLVWMLPLLNSSVTDFQIRYNTKSRDTGYEFKTSTFDIIRFPTLTKKEKQQLYMLTNFIKDGDITLDECNDWVCRNIYKLADEELSLIKECQQYWFKKHVQSIKNVPSPY